MQILTDQTCRRQSIHDRHLNVHQDGIDVTGTVLKPLDRLLAIVEKGRPRALDPQHPFDQQPIHRAVVDHEVVTTAQPRPPRLIRGIGRARLGALCRATGERKLEPEITAVLDLAVRADRAAHQIDQQFTDGET